MSVAFIYPARFHHQLDRLTQNAAHASENVLRQYWMLSTTLHIHIPLKINCNINGNNLSFHSSSPSILMPPFPFIQYFGLNTKMKGIFILMTDVGTLNKTKNTVIMLGLFWWTC